MSSFQQRLLNLQQNLKEETESSRRRSVDSPTHGRGQYLGSRSHFGFFTRGSRDYGCRDSVKNNSTTDRHLKGPLSSKEFQPQNSDAININNNGPLQTPQSLIRQIPSMNAQCLSPRPRPKALAIKFGSPGRPDSPSRQPKPLVFNVTRPITASADSNMLNERFQQNSILFIDKKRYNCNESDLQHLDELGSGSCGQVNKMLHKKSARVVAVKQMRRSGNDEESKRIAMDLDVLLKCHDCEHIVQCYGYLIKDTEVWICMELMATCFDKLLKKLKAPFPERICGKVAVSTVKALNYLKENHNVIHRDVKPSNILLNEKGIIKLCDFGISGRLVDSKAKTRQAGCAAYMAPERIDPPDPSKPSYDIRADVWSLGISLVELAMGKFPYSECKTDFEVLTKVIQDEPPWLPTDGTFSNEFCDFVKLCLTKNYRNRPKYKKLLEHPFIKQYEKENVNVAAWFARVTSSGPHEIDLNNSLQHFDNNRVYLTETMNI